MNEEKIMKPCRICGKVAEYFEFECNDAFTAPVDLRFEGLFVWGPYSTHKRIICQTDTMVHFAFENGDERIVQMLGFNQEALNEKIRLAHEKRELCQHEECKEIGFPYFSAFDMDDPIGYYCENHMSENGVCPGRHYFMAGNENFDFSTTGYCESCDAELFENDYDDEDDDYLDWNDGEYDDFADEYGE